MASRRPRSPRGWGWSAWSTWAPPTSSARRSTSTGCSSSARRTDYGGRARNLVKRGDRNHTVANKINNTIGRGLLSGRMGKTRIIAESGAGQHGVASGTVAARLGLECVVYMGATDIERQKINVYRMQLLGASVVPVTSGSATLKDALNEAMRDWVTHLRDTFYIIVTVAGPDPSPRLVDRQSSLSGKSVSVLVELGG